MEDFEPLEFPPKLPVALQFSSVDAQKVSRRKSEPLNREKYLNFLDDEQRVTDEYKLRKEIFRCGICSDARREIWPFLFGIYQFLTSKKERDVIRTDNMAKYTVLKERWKTMLRSDSTVTEKVRSPSYLKDIEECEPTFDSHLSPEAKQQLKFSQIQAQVYCGRLEIDLPNLLSAIKIIDKDVPRTDRSTAYFSGADNVHLLQLRDMLITFTAYHPDVGYAQGMNDLAARFFSVLDDEVDAYWCLVNYLEHMKDDFIEDRLLTKLKLVRQLLAELDQDLLHYLDQLEVGDLTFCHRWMLLCFKREFSEEDSLRCFEILSCRHLDLSTHEAEKTTQHLTSQTFQQNEGKGRVIEAPQNTEFTFEVFMCATVLMHYRDKIFLCQENSDVFCFVAGLTMKMNLNEILEKTETLFYSYCKKSAIQDAFQVLELPSPDTEESRSIDSKS